MLMPLVATVALALGLAPCVLQRACPARRPRPPATVCMHRVRSLRTYDRDCRDGTSTAGVSDGGLRLRRRRAKYQVREQVETCLRMQLDDLLLFLRAQLHQDRLMSYCRALALFALLAVTNQTTTGCKNCIVLGKEEKAMFRAHSAACATQSHAPPRLVDALLAGELHDEPALRRHVYCVLLKCKLISKDGKLQKAAVLGKMAARPDAKNATKALESCADQTGDTPEDLAWNLFRCGYDKKALLFEYMPTNVASEPDNNS